MQILFIDESGTPPKPGKAYPRYFVVGGIIIPEVAWHRTRDALMGMKVRQGIRGELKWRYFSPDNTDERNPMRKLDQTTRDQIRSEIYKLICDDGSLRTLAVICSAAAAYEMPSISTQDDVYNLTYKPISERFQYHLQDVSKPTGRKEFGIIVGDHRGVQDDKRLRAHHQKLLHSGAEFVSKYENLIEGLFLEPSHLSIGIQLADMVAGAIWRKYERNDGRWYDMLAASLRRSSTGEIPGYGVIKVPKTTWR